MRCVWRRLPALLVCVIALGTSGCAAGSGASPSPVASTLASPSPSTSPATAPANGLGSFTFSGWLEATSVGPVDPLPFATPAGAVPGVAPTASAGGALLTGSAAGTQCFHASSRNDIDQYEALLVFLVRGQRYLLSLAFGFQHPGQSLGEATPPAGGRLSDAGGNVDQVHLDPEGVPLRDDPMFLGSYRDGTVVLARDLHSGSVDITLRGLPGPSGVPVVRLTGRFACP